MPVVVSSLHRIIGLMAALSSTIANLQWFTEMLGRTVRRDHTAWMISEKAVPKSYHDRRGDEDWPIRVRVLAELT